MRIAQAILATLILVTSVAAQPRRDGHLQPGMPAPDFTLRTKDDTHDIRLSELQGKPTVLIFGSYT